MLRFSDNVCCIRYLWSVLSLLQGEGGPEDCKEALETLFSVLMTMIRLMVS